MTVKKMDRSFKISLHVSIIFHALILLTFTAKKRQVVSIPLNIDLIRVKPAVQKKEPAVPKDDFAKKRKKEEKKDEPVKKEETNKKTVEADEAKPQVIRASSNMLLEAKEFPFTYYLKILQNKIASNWDWPVMSGTLKATAYFKIQRNGLIAELNIDSTSGDYLFDQAAKRAVNLASPLPPLPEAYEEEDLGIYFEFSFHE